MVGVITLLDSLFLYPGSHLMNSVDNMVLRTSIHAVRMLNNVASVNRQSFQDVISGSKFSEDLTKVKRVATSGSVSAVIQNEFYHLMSFWLGICNCEGSVKTESASHMRTVLLHESLLLIGYCVTSNAKTQHLVRIGRYPVILQQISTLPFQYYCNPT